MKLFLKEFGPLSTVSYAKTGINFILKTINELFTVMKAIHKPNPDIIKPIYLYGFQIFFSSIKHKK